MPKVLIADRHAMTRRGYRYFLENAIVDIECEEAGTSQSVAEVLTVQEPDLILLDQSLPDFGSLDVLALVRHRYPHVRVMILSALADAHHALVVFRAGADGLLEKTADETEVATAVRTVLDGRRYMSSEVASALASYRRADPTTARLIHQILSTREFQVFCKLASGLTLSRIAVHLSLSVKTVSTYRGRVLEKMSLGCNADMTRYALRTGLID
jgi:two-component system invasion response regulator UvrY